MRKRIIGFFSIAFFIFVMLLVCAFALKNKILTDSSNDLDQEAIAVNKQDVLNLKDYGAEGNGYTDDYLALYNAIHDAINNKKKLFIPAGNYYCSSTIVINGDLEIYGEGQEKTILSYSDAVINKNENNTRGMITFDAYSLAISDMTIRYDANTTTNYTIDNGEYKPGLLLCILSGNSINLNRCTFLVGGELNPPVTCIWVKAEKNICNVNIDSCDVINYSTSSVGGGLWLAAHDTEATSISNVSITNCYIEKHGNDEAFAIWGHRVSDVSIYKNHIYYKGDKNDVLISIGVYGCSGLYDGVTFSNNTIEILDKAMFGIKIEDFRENSNVVVSDNTINASIDENNMFCVFCLSSTNGLIIHNNSTKISGGDEVSYVICGNDISAEFDSEKYLTDNSNSSTMFRAGSYDNESPLDITINNSSFILGVKDTMSNRDYVRFPSTSGLKLENCEIDVE